MVVRYVVPITLNNPAEAGDWKKYMFTEHIPDVRATNCLLPQAVEIHRVVTPEGMVTDKFQVHYYFEDVKSVVIYRQQHGLALKGKYDASGWGAKTTVGDRFILNDLELEAFTT